MFGKSGHTSFESMFREATDFHPFPYQKRIAEGERGFPELIKIPTGAGKTAGIILSWIWKRRFAPQKIREATPRRLVYCLPMRVLVEQTYEESIRWMDRLSLLSGRAEWKEVGNGRRVLDNYISRSRENSSRKDPGISVHILMGGEVDVEWDRYPENECILIGTQDMLLSRALNRGYAMSRFRWPVDFGLLNNDCLWVMDEVQLMGVGLATSAQLDAFRNSYGTFGSCQTVWMSATCEPEWIQTVDRSAPQGQGVLGLSRGDLDEQVLRERINAGKKLERTGFSLTSTSKKGLKSYIQSLGNLVIEKHISRASAEEAPLTLVILNTVDRAQRLYRFLREEVSDEKNVHSIYKEKLEGDHLENTPKSSELLPELVLVHSRFRQAERRRLNKVLSESPGEDGFPEGGRIIISTQVVEAGVDISSGTLITELTPWTSLVQRFGRLNRYGEHSDAKAVWVDISVEGRTAEECALPYTPEELSRAQNLLEGLDGISPAEIEELEVSLPYTPVNVIRRKDIVELFDNTPDLSGNDIDVSRFVRDITDRDVQVFWRDWDRNSPEQEDPLEDLPPAKRTELCSVPLWSFREFAKRADVWLWDHLDGRWVEPNRNQIIPGRIFLIHCDSGGYDPEVGWQQDEKTAVEPVETEGEDGNKSTGEDLRTVGREWLTLKEHTEDVLTEIKGILTDLSLPGLENRYKDVLTESAFYHDLGKAHPVFQNAILDLVENEKERQRRAGTLWAKSGVDKIIRYERKYFRHELASALALLKNPDSIRVKNLQDVDLVSYLVAAHHGKVRVSIRSLPGEDLPWENDES
ncbi:MAG: CRISPR-associated endonuclease Cas3'', partial [Thermoproteota archaeon]